MNVNNILQGTLPLLKLNTTVLASDTAEKILLIKCLNMTFRELADEYVVFRKSENVAFTDGKAAYTLFSENVKAVITVKNGRGEKLLFSEAPDGLIANTETAEVTYAYIPAELVATSNIVAPPALTARMLIYGTASEYALMKDMFEECAVLNEKYMRAVISGTRKLRALSIKKRRWI